MNAIIYLICGIILFPIIFANNPNYQNMNDLTKEEIIALYEKHSGKKINSPKDFCVEKAESFNGVYALGFFAHDRGCRGNEILVGNQIGNIGEMTSKALVLSGWDDKSKQQELALKWAKEMLLAWESPLSTSNDDFNSKFANKFEAPSCTAENDRWIVKIWVQKPAGMRPQADYYQLKIVFDKNGNIIEQNNINSFVVYY